MDSHVLRRNPGNDVENHMQSIKCPQLVILVSDKQFYSNIFYQMG